MNKLRLTIYMEMGYNKDGDYLVSCVSDELINIEKKIIAHEGDIYVEIIDIEEKTYREKKRAWHDVAIGFMIFTVCLDATCWIALNDNMI